MYEREPVLPEGIDKNDLRYVHPELYPLSMAPLGWEVLLGFDIDNDPFKVAYSLNREVQADFDTKALAEKIGMLGEEGKLLDGYSLKLGINRDKKPSLEFNFTGFPTKKTMDIMKALENEFNPKGIRPVMVRFTSDSMDEREIDQIVFESNNRKSPLARIREIFRR